ncbi:MAG: hypothetical protein NVSMB10_19270 [Steroidobacteraceae bacterium]
MSAEHREAWELLPWLVNGRLSELDARRVESHLRSCDQCREEHDGQRRIYKAMAAASTAVERMPVAGLGKLRIRIDESRPNDAVAQGDIEPMLAAPSRRVVVRRFNRAAAAVAAVAVTLVGMLVVQQRAPSARLSEPAAYYTVTTPVLHAPRAAIRAVFTANITLADLQALLDDAHVKIVYGPTEAGVYTLATTGSQSVAAALKRLRGEQAVRFAEDLGESPSEVRSP